MNPTHHIIEATLIEEKTPIYLEELCHVLQIDHSFLLELISHDIIQPQGHTMADWCFDSYHFKRAKMAVSFYYDLEINLNGIAVILELLESLKQPQQDNGARYDAQDEQSDSK